MSQPQLSGSSEILRSNQKDDEYLRYLRNLTADISQKCFGIPFWMKWKDLSSALSDALFFSLTTLSGLQTLGEEYANIIQVDRSLSKVPSRWARFIDVLFRTLGQYFLLRWQTRLENQLSSLPPLLQNQSVLVHIPTLLRAIALLQRLHLIAFYFYGNYYHLSRRLLGIKHVVIRRWLSQSSNQTPYKILGYIALTQLCLSLIVSFYSSQNKNLSFSSSEASREKLTEESVICRNQCSLCFEVRLNSTATPCGHLFCWKCITSWMQNKEECPLCRESFPPSKLILLQNYY